MNSDASSNAPDPESRSLHAVLEGCPISAAIVANGRLCFANALFVENTQLAAGAEGLRVVFDNGPSGQAGAAPDGKDAVLVWNAADGNECRIRLVARTASYGGEDAFFLWVAGLVGDTAQQAARYVPAAGQSAPEPAPSPASLSAPPATPRARILLAEDNEINQEIAIELLEQVGMEIEVASNGQEAVDLFLKKDFDLILMDIQMPMMDGMDATRTIRASGKAGADAVPILAMTAHGMSGDREKSLDVGMNDHITKPINPQLLYATLDAWLPKKGSAPAVPPGAAPAPPETGGRSLPAQTPVPADAPQQDVLFGLHGIDAQAGLANVVGNRELYLRLLDRFARNYRNSGLELRDALKRMAHDASAHEEAVRLAHTAKGVAANLGASALATVAGELESAIKKRAAQEDMLERYGLLLSEALDAIESLPKRDDARVGQQAISAADKERIAAVLDVLPALMQADWYNAQQMLLELAPVVEDTVASAHFREVSMALEEFDSEGVAEKGKLLLAAI
jgi:CheY-like chemotaxis protein